MAHNRSPTRVRSDVFQAPLACFRGWVLEVECGGRGCPVGRLQRVDVLDRRYPGIRMMDVVNRFRCIRCGSGPVAVVLSETRAMRRLPLRGPEIRY